MHGTIYNRRFNLNFSMFFLKFFFFIFCWMKPTNSRAVFWRCWLLHFGWLHLAGLVIWRAQICMIFFPRLLDCQVDGMWGLSSAFGLRGWCSSQWGACLNAHAHAYESISDNFWISFVWFISWTNYNHHC